MLQTISSVTSKGQVTIPIDYRKYLGISAGDRVSFEKNMVDGNETISIKPVKTLFDFEGSIKSRKKYTKARARAVYIKEVVAGRI